MEAGPARRMAASRAPPVAAEDPRAVTIRDAVTYLEGVGDACTQHETDAVERASHVRLDTLM